jgi:hypothetical protein
MPHEVITNNLYDKAFALPSRPAAAPDWIPHQI